VQLVVMKTKFFANYMFLADICLVFTSNQARTNVADVVDSIRFLVEILE